MFCLVVPGEVDFDVEVLGMMMIFRLTWEVRVLSYDNSMYCEVTLHNIALSSISSLGVKTTITCDAR